jgi:hypothetical protein
MSSADTTSHPASAQRRLLTQHPLISFFIMAYAFS